VEFGTTFAPDWLSDFDALRTVATDLDQGGIDFVGYGGHVLTAAEGRFDRPATTYAVPFRDPFVLYSHLAASTTRLRFRSGILILPMFPTALVAKQSAELALVSGGRFELGVGISWNEPEYRAMGQDLAVRGARLEEQLAVLGQLWRQPLVTFAGRFHDIDALGLGQLPASPIPIWVGCGNADPLLSRVARLADGWMPIGVPAAERITHLQELASHVGRTEPIGVTLRLGARPDDLPAALDEAQNLVATGATSLSISPPAGASARDGVAAVLATHDYVRARLAT
jgi:probable F420-dependent oxidoreductase